MQVPWSDLGLSLAWLDSDSETVLFDFETFSQTSAATESPGLPRLAYPNTDFVRADAITFDLRLLSRAVLPTLSEHGLVAVCEHFDLAAVGRETEVLAELIQALVIELSKLDRDVLALLSQLLSTPWDGLLNKLLVYPQMIEADEPPAESTTESASDPGLIESAEDALSADGPIAASFGAFETRQGQQDMTRAVEAAFRDGHAALVEAGPGTGKTFAYLIPAILHLRENPSDRVIVSTRTRQLQEQLYGKDVPFLVERLASDLKVALLKGRENYLCFRRWQTLIGELTESLEQELVLPRLAPLVRWMAETETGDIEENSAFQADPESRLLWRRLGDSAHHCTGAFCPFNDECFSVLARRRARRADLVVVNHSLLLGDLAVDNVVLGKYTHLVIDEAHTLEAAARMAFTRQLTERSFVRLADDLSPVGRRRRGWLQRTPFQGGIERTQRIDDVLRRLRSQIATAFRQFSQALPEERRADFSTLPELSEHIIDTPVLLKQLEDSLDALSDCIEDEEPLKELEGHIRIVQSLMDVVTTMSVPPSDNTVHWYERGAHALVFHATPLDVAPFLEQLLYPKLKAIVLTSATLSLGGSFDFLCRSVGLSEENFSINTLVAQSPFAYEDRMRIFVPRYFPPANGELAPYAEALAELLASVSAEVGKNGLALFTSYAMMQAVNEALPDDVETLVQGELSRTALIDRFRNTDRPIWLLGTESFWEGVNFPGEELEVLVVARLPFPVPSDPVFAAMGHRMMRSGGDPFFDLSIPLAGLKLRQGVGRLIRTTVDHGLVFLTDQRIVTRGYGQRFAASLPVGVEPIDSPQRLLSELSRWFDKSNALSSS